VVGLRLEGSHVVILFLFTFAFYVYEQNSLLIVAPSKLSYLDSKAMQLLVLSQASASGSSSINAAGRNALVTSVMICCGFVVCWSLNEISFFLNVIGVVQMDFAGWYYHFTVVMVLLSSCINPFIYAAKYRDFQTGVRNMMKKNSSSVSAAG